MRNHRSGFVLVVTLLVLAVVVGAFVTSAAVSMVGARRGASFERVTYQALRVAENAVNTFASRVVAAGYTGAFTDDSLTAWIEADEDREGLLVYTDAAGTAVIELRDAGRPATGTIAATAAVAGGVKTVLRDVTRAAGPPLSPGALAALNSIPSVDARGAAVIRGESYMDSDGMLDLGAILDVPAPVLNGAGDVSVAFASSVFLRPGFHVDVGGARFRVESVEGTTPAVVRLIQVHPQAATVLTIDDAASLIGTGARSIPLAVVSRVETVTPTATVVDIPTANSVRQGDCVRLDLDFGEPPDSTVYVARVSSVDESGPTATLDFASPDCPPSTTYSPVMIPAGAALIRDVVSAESAGTVTANKLDEKYPSGYTEGSTWLGQYDPSVPPEPGESPNDPEGLFADVFGMTKSQFIDFALSHPQGRVIERAEKFVEYHGVTFARSADNASFCGSGVMVIDADVHFTAGPHCSFTGILYVIGDFFHAGNSVFEGAVVVQGTSYIDELAELGDDTELRGTGRSDDKVRYDLGAILTASNLVPTNAEATYVVGSWRQE